MSNRKATYSTGVCIPSQPRDWMKTAREWAFLTNHRIPESMIIYLAEFGKYVADTTERKPQ